MAHKGDSGQNGDETTATRRRRFIIAQVESKGFVSTANIGKAGHSIAPGSLAVDKKLFQDLGLPIRSSPEGFASTRPSFRRKIIERLEENLPEKCAIGEFAAALLTGATTPEWRPRLQDNIESQLSVSAATRAPRTPNDINASELAGLLRVYLQQERADDIVKDVLTLLETRNAKEYPSERETADRIIDFLKDFHQKRNRQVALDSGSTTLAIAKCLAVTARDRLVRLRVLTNSPMIENEFADVDTKVDVVGIGGLISKDTAARTGYLLDLCLSAWDLQVDVALVGATSLRFDRTSRPLGFACDTESEANTKSLLLEKANLIESDLVNGKSWGFRIICA